MLRYLVTAGPTREYIDPVRYLSNDSSGRMGVALVAAALDAGHAATLVHGPMSVAVPEEISAVAVTSARDMHEACVKEWPCHDVLIMAAAVADYRPSEAFEHKHKRSEEDWQLRLVPNPDVVKSLVGAKTARQVVIGFALEDQDGRENAEKKLRRKGLDAIVLNHPQVIGGSDSAVEILVGGGTWRAVPLTDKSSIAVEIIRVADELAGER